ncbi:MULTISPECIES: PIN domain-containing protein [Nitrosopumilus]|nr:MULTISPECIES: PIN domain-containing protein [Nitrosopumilus]
MATVQFESMLALDSCVVIATIKSPKIARKIIRIFRGNNSRVILQDVVLKEASKILGIPKEEVLEKISAILRKEVQVFTTTDSMRNEATRYENQYGICHNPDSKILAAAKTFSWTLLTMDKKMLQTAEFEGILALNPVWVGGK